MPKISVIMGVYNGSKRIKGAIESILNQTFTDFELIVCDDGSTDDSLEILNELALKDNRIIILQNETNLQLATTLNRCLKISKGEYIARMDDDDISHPERFEKQIRFLDMNPDYAIVGTNRNMYDDDGIWGKTNEYGERTSLEIYMGKSFVHPSVLMRRDAVVSVSGYSTSPDIGRTEDFDLWCKLYNAGYKGFIIKDILLNYYEARDSYNKRKYKYRVYEYNLKKIWHRKLGLPQRYLIFAYRPLIVGLLPVRFLMYYHEMRFKRVN